MILISEFQRHSFSLDTQLIFPYTYHAKRQAYVNAGLGDLHISSGNVDVALKYLAESNSVFREKNIKYGLVLVHKSLGKAEVDPKECLIDWKCANY